MVAGFAFNRGVDHFGSAFFTRSFTPENLAHKFGSDLALQHSIPRPRDDLFPAQLSLPFAS
jgi:hypothetical protein